MIDEATIWAVLETEPDKAPVFADWFQERDQQNLAHALRWADAWKRWPEPPSTARQSGWRPMNRRGHYSWYAANHDTVWMLSPRRRAGRLEKANRISRPAVERAILPLSVFMAGMQLAAPTTKGQMTGLTPIREDFDSLQDAINFLAACLLGLAFLYQIAPDSRMVTWPSPLLKREVPA